MYTHAHNLGDDVTAPAPAAEQAPTVAPKTPHFTRQALAMMGVTLLPWLPVIGGAWVGDKVLSRHGQALGALGGFTFSVLMLRYAAKQMAGNIT